MSVHAIDCVSGMRLFLADHSVDAAIVDPEYGDTSLEWDVKDDAWINQVARVLKLNGSLWVFGSLRYMAHVFPILQRLGFRYSQDVVWEKQNGTGFHNDRFRRVHEHVALFYRGKWADVYHETQFTNDATARAVRRKTRPTHTGYIESSAYTSIDGGPRMMRSVLQHRNEHGRAIHPTQKPVELIRPLLRYSVPPDGLVLAPFAGSGSDGEACKIEGFRYIGFEIDVAMAEKANQRIAAA